MTDSMKCPLDYPAVLYAKTGPVPLEAEQKLAEVLPLLIAKKLLGDDAWPSDSWLGTVHKMTLLPQVADAFRLLGLIVPEGSVSLSSLASQLLARVRELSQAYLTARTGIRPPEGFYVVHADYVRPEVMFWSSVDDVVLHRGQLLLTGRPVRLRSDGTFGASRQYPEWLWPGDNTWLIPASGCPTKKDKVALYRAASTLAEAVKTKGHAEA